MARKVEALRAIWFFARHEIGDSKVGSYNLRMADNVSAALPVWAGRLIAQLDDADRRAQAVAKGLTTEQINWHPQPGAWSVGQCLDHLLISNQQYLPAISGALPGKARSPVPEIKIGWFGTWFIRSFVAASPGTKKVKAPGKIVPHQQVELSVLEGFLSSNQSLRVLIREACHYDVNRIRFKNPFIPLIYFTVGTGLELTAKHEDRHLLQAERVKQAQGFPEK